MTGFISDKDGGVWRLPPLIAWDMTHGMGLPCDCFSVVCLYSGDMAEPLRRACRFRAEENGETVFTGVIDEYEAAADAGGRRVTLHGRGLAALLMDNEAEAAEYYGAGLAFILEKHVTPFGISEVRKKDMAKAARFEVTKGMSEWRLLSEFCRFCGGTEPRFSRDGVLLIDGSRGERRELDGDLAVTSERYTDRRYGVISEALVTKRGGAAVSVKNDALLARGGSARRVVSAPRRASYDDMRYTGSWQIRESARGAEVCRITLPRPFAAFAGDRLLLRSSPLGITGEFLVAESRTVADRNGAETILKLERC
ncbi:MAG: hypothetical protein RR055_04610 [Oscillospiraceae bacterium]